MKAPIPQESQFKRQGNQLLTFTCLSNHIHMPLHCNRWLQSKKSIRSQIINNKEG